jgi:hypothetical protein
MKTDFSNILQNLTDLDYSDIRYQSNKICEITSDPYGIKSEEKHLVGIHLREYCSGNWSNVLACGLDELKYNRPKSKNNKTNYYKLLSPQAKSVIINEETVKNTLLVAQKEEKIEIMKEIIKEIERISSTPKYIHFQQIIDKCGE